MKKPGDSQQVVDDYVEALLGDVLGATEGHRAPDTAGAVVAIAEEPAVSLTAAPVVREVARSSPGEDALAVVPVPFEAAGTVPVATMRAEAMPVEATVVEATPLEAMSAGTTSGATLSPDAGTAGPARIEAMPRGSPRMQPFGAATAPVATAPLAAIHPTITPVAPPAAVPAAQRWLRVTVGGDSYALELLSVQEVVRVAPIVAMRGAGRAVLGVMNLRGRIVPVFDLGLWLGTACVRPDERSRIVVVERHDELIGVLVSGVDDVVTLGRERIEPPLPGTRPGAILGIARVVAAPTVLLDAGALFV